MQSNVIRITLINEQVKGAQQRRPIHIDDKKSGIRFSIDIGEKTAVETHLDERVIAKGETKGCTICGGREEKMIPLSNGKSICLACAQELQE